MCGVRHLPGFTNIEEGRAGCTLFAFHKEVATGCFIGLVSIVNKKIQIIYTLKVIYKVNKREVI